MKPPAELAGMFPENSGGRVLNAKTMLQTKETGSEKMTDGMKGKTRKEVPHDHQKMDYGKW